MIAARATTTASRGRAWRPGDQKRMAWILATSLFGAALVIVGVFFQDTWSELLRTWTGVATYNYGLIVPFLSLYLIVRMRAELARITPTPSLWGVLAVASISLVWATGDLAGVLAIKQFAVLAIIPAMGLAILGTSVMRAAAFPFFFVMLALPMGEFLIPQLIAWTADFTVVAIEFLGIPVFHDGPFIRIPAGDFHVVKACSGIRYLLTALVLGALFAYLSFKSWRRRAAFILVCLVVPIVANWLRATGIILIAQLSGMRLAVGIDHFIYGWIFFGFVMLIIFLIGSRFMDRDPKEPLVDSSVHDDDERNDLMVRKTPFLSVFLFTLVVSPLGVVLSAELTERAAEFVVEREEIVLPVASTNWRRQDTLSSDWNPVFVGARIRRSAEYRSGYDGVLVTAVYYDVQEEGAELIGAQNSLYEPVTWWGRFDRRATYHGEDSVAELHVREVSVSNGEHNRLIWSWYSISGSELASEYRAKLALFQALVGGDGSGAYLVALAVDYEQDIQAARQSLEGFLGEYLQHFRHCLGTSVNNVGGKCD